MRNDSSRTEFPPAAEPKVDPMQTLGKTTEQLTDEADKYLADKEKQSGGPISFRRG